MTTYHVVRADLYADREHITSIWRRNLTIPGDLDAKYNWQFFQNPYAQGYCWLVQADAAPIGTVSLGPRLVYAQGEIVTIGVVGDFAIDKQHRLAQPALMLQRAVMSSINDGMRMIYGIPNPRALPLMKRVGYKEATPVHRYAKPLAVSFYLKRHPLTRSMPSWAASTADRLCAAWERSTSRIMGGSSSACLVETFDERFDDLWTRSARPDRVMGVRDRRFLQWRFGDCPLRSYKTLVLLARGGSRLDGYLVFYVENNVLICTDLAVARGGEDLRTLIGHTAEYARGIGATSISIACVLSPPMMATLAGCHFRQRTIAPADPTPTPHLRARSVLVHSRSEDALLEHGWYLTLSDEDNN